jgi:hypothetical protein
MAFPWYINQTTITTRGIWRKRKVAKEGEKKGGRLHGKKKNIINS